MKKLVIVLFIILFTAFSGKSQAFKKGDMVLNVGIGLGSTYGTYHSGISPSFTATFERGFWEIGDFGVIGIGALAGYQRSGYGYYGNNYHWNDFYFGARGIFHFTVIPVEKLDVYAAIGTGLRIDSEPDWGYDYNPSTSFGVYGGVVGGARYYFTDKFAAFGELGYEISWLKLGVAFKF
jgi:hypothetical protein